MSPHPIPPPVSAPPRTSTLLPLEQPIVFHKMNTKPQHREAALRGLQHSGSGDCPHSPVRVKPRVDPPSTPTQGDLQDHLVGRQQQTSWAQSRGTNPQDEGGVGHSGGSQSSNHHKRTNQGQNRSSPGLASSRPAPSATTTSDALAATSQGKRQPEERDRSVTKKVRYLFCWSIENLCLSTCLNPCKGLSNQILQINSFT